MDAKTILIVDDNKLNVNLFNDLLEANGYKTLHTNHGLEALKIAREHKPDLILLDIQLPDISGFEVTKWLKLDEELKHIPIIAITAFPMQGDGERILKLGCEAYIAKPVPANTFLDTIQKFLGS